MNKQELELKNYLQATRFLKISLEYEIKRLNELREMIYSIKSPELVKNKISGGEVRNKLEDGVIKIVDTEKRLQDKIEKWQRMVEEREHLIEKVGDPLLENILKMRYLEGVTTEKVSSELCYTMQRIQQLQKKALKKLLRVVKTA